MRMRFTKAEKAAFTVGTRVEWRNGRHWHPGIVIEPIRKCSTGSGFEELGLRHIGRTTATVSTGAYITGSPTAVRLPAST